MNSSVVLTDISNRVSFISSTKTSAMKNSKLKKRREFGKEKSSETANNDDAYNNGKFISSGMYIYIDI